jgi:hypothetical protein
MPTEESYSTSNIGTLNEKPLHAALKSWYAKANDKFEVDVDGYVVDILRDDLIIEIQTKNFSMIRRKLANLSDRHPMRLVYPIPSEKWIIKVNKDGNTPLSRRKSPKRGTYEDLFEELVSFPSLIKNPNFSLEILLIQEEEIRIHDPQRAWRRRGWVTQERRLIDVLEQHCFGDPKALMTLFPQSIESEFTTSDLAAALQSSIRLAGKMAYCLREMGAILPVGKRRNAILYTRA